MHIYYLSARNYDTSNPTVLTIEGVYKHGENQALNVSLQVTFRNVVRDASGNISSQDIIPLQRNHLYNVVLTPKYDNGALVFDEIDYAIQVVDWQNGETIVFAGDDKLTATSTPNYVVEDALSYYSTEASFDGIHNPNYVVASLSESTIKVIVTSQTTGTMMECPEFTSAKGSYGLLSTSNDIYGNLVETYYITVKENVLGSDSYTFKINNAINTAQAREFVLTQRPRQLPIYYIAPYDLNGLNSFATDVKSNHSAMFSYSKAQTYAYSATNSYKTINSVSYHLPTYDECRGILPCYQINWNDNTITTVDDEYIVFGPGTEKITLPNESHPHYKAIYYSPSGSNTIYYLKMIGTQYACAYKFAYVTNDPENNAGAVTQILTCKYVGAAFHEKYTSLDDAVRYLYTNWASINAEESIVKFSEVGHTNSNTDYQGVGAALNNDKGFGYWWTVPGQVVGTIGTALGKYPNSLHLGSNIANATPWIHYDDWNETNNYGFAIRLFRDTLD